MADAGIAQARARRLRPGLLDLYLIRGVAGPFLAILAGTCLVMMLERALRVIRLLAESGADIGYFLPMMAQLMPYYFNLALPAAFMVALVLLVARLDDNLELEAMLAGGLSLGRIAMPLAAFGLVIALASLIAGGWLEPVGRHGFNALKAAAVNSGRIGSLQPRAFYHPAEGLAFSFDRRLGDGRVGGAFAWQRTGDGTRLVLTGAGARIGFAPDDRRMEISLTDGRYLAERPGAAPMTLRFDALNFGDALLLEEAGWARGRSQKELTLSELIGGRGRGNRGITDAEIGTEIHSRIARAATIPLIPFLVLPLAFATKRGRRGLGILLGGILLAAFHHGINFARQPAAAGTVSPEAAIWGVAAAAAVLTLIVFWTGRHLPSRSPIAGALAPAGRMLARARPQEAGRLRAMRGLTLATYLGWRLAKWALMAAFAIVLLLQLVDLVEQGDAFAARQMGAGDILYYASLRLPPMLHQAIPIAALAAAMGVFAGLGRAQEMVAIRAAGLSQYRLLAMALPVPLLLAGASWLLAERAAPASEARLAAWWAAHDPQPARAEHWFRIGAEIVRAETASPDGARLGGVTIFRRDARGLLTEQVRAAAAVEGEGGWRLTGVERHRFAANRVLRSTAAEDSWATPMRAADVTMLFSRAATLSSDLARRSLDASAPASGSAALFATRLHRSWAEPLAPLAMLLLALPLAFAGHRRTAWLPWLYAGLGGLVYLTLDGVFTVAGQVGALPPPVGAWLAPVLFLLGGLTVLLYGER